MYLFNAVLFVVCAVMNLINGIQTGNGFCFVLTALWMLGSVVSFVRYRQIKNQKSSGEDEA